MRLPWRPVSRNLLVSVLPSSLYKRWENLPRNGPIQWWLWYEIEDGNKEANKAKQHQNSIKWLESGVTEDGDPDNNGDCDSGLGKHSTPGNDAVIKPRPWLLITRDAMNGIDFDSIYVASAPARCNHVAAFMDEQDT